MISTSLEVGDLVVTIVLVSLEVGEVVVLVFVLRKLNVLQRQLGNDVPSLKANNVVTKQINSNQNVKVHTLNSVSTLLRVSTIRLRIPQTFFYAKSE